METIDQLVGLEQDWASYITNVEMRETPFLDWLGVGSRPVNPLFQYQVEAYRAPRENRHVDGQPWKEPASAGEGRAKLISLIQWFENGISISKLTQDVSSDPAITDQLAHEIPKALKEMATDMEVAFLEDYDHLEDNKTTGYRTRGVGSWLSTTAQSLYPVPTAYLLPAGSTVATTSANRTENELRTILQNIWEESKSSEDIDAFAGSDVIKYLSDFQYRLPSTGATPTSQSTFTRTLKDKTLNRSVRRYEGDFQNVSFIPEPWLVKLSATGTPNIQKGRAYLLHRSKWEVRWNQQPRVYRPEFKGGSYEAFMDCLAMLVCKNPKAEGKIAPTA